MAKAKVKTKTKKNTVKAKVKKSGAKPQAKKKVKAQPKVKAKPKAKAKPAIKAKLARNQGKSKKSSPSKATKPTVVKASLKNPISASKPKAKLIDVSQFVTPLDDRMIVQVSEGEKITAGGIIIPDTVSNVSGNREGVVLSVGRGHRDPKGRLRPMDVRKGDKIVFAEFAGSKLNYQGQNLVILRETDVMGVLD